MILLGRTLSQCPQHSRICHIISLRHNNRLEPLALGGIVKGKEQGSRVGGRGQSQIGSASWRAQ